ncbi:hypothetical protein pb186bvf_019342 [Paramecium bursaria]
MFIILIPIIRCISLQNLQETFRLDLLNAYSDYVNPSFEAKLTSKSLFTDGKPKPDVYITDALTVPSIREFDSKEFCPIAEWSIQDLPITFFLSPTTLTQLQYTISDDVAEISDIKEYDLKRFGENILCHSIYGLDNSLQFNIDCELDQQFQNISVNIKLSKTLQVYDLVFNIYRYQFQLYGDYWKQCLRKEIKHLQIGAEFKLLFYCTYDGFVQSETYKDQLILIENEHFDETIIVTAFNRWDFEQCSKKQLDSFRIQHLVVNPFLAINQVYDPNDLWLLAMLIQDQSGICKCGGLRTESIRCQFLELQDGIYTQLYISQFTDRSNYIYVSSQTFLYKIKIAQTIQVTYDYIEQYYFIYSSEIYYPFKLVIYYEFIVVVLTQDTYNDFCLKARETDITTQQISLVFQKHDKAEQYTHNLIFYSYSSLFRVRTMLQNGNFMILWDERFSLMRLTQKYLVIEYSHFIEEDHYLEYELELKITYGDYQVYVDKMPVTIFSYDDFQFYILDDSNQTITFEEEKFYFDLIDQIKGPMLSFIEIPWDQFQETNSVIEYIREIQFNSIIKNFTRIFRTKFIFDGVNSQLFVLGTVKKSEFVEIGFQSFDYVNKSFRPGVFNSSQILGFPTEEINFVQVNLLTILIGDQNTNYLVVCYLNNLEQCAKIQGDILKYNRYFHASSFEEDCVSNLLYMVPEDQKKVVVFKYSCPDLNLNKQIMNAQIIGQIDQFLIDDLINFPIIDCIFNIIDDRVSFLLLGNGKIIQMVSFTSFLVDKIEFQIINEIQDCLPHDEQASRIFYLENEGKMFLIYVCAALGETKIFEYYLENPYHIQFSREYSLYIHNLNTEYKSFTDSQVVYIPVDNLSYLVFCPYLESPNMLLHLIEVKDTKNFHAQTVIINNQDTTQWDIFSMAFFTSENNSFLYYLSGKPKYYGQMLSSKLDQSDKMVLVYQQNNEKLLFRQYNIEFDYEYSTIVVGEEDYYIETTDDTIDLHISDYKIDGSIEDINLNIEQAFDDLVVQKFDLLQLNQYMCTRYETLEYGEVLDMLDIDQIEYETINKGNNEESNLIFVISKFYLVIFEKSQPTETNGQPNYKKIQILTQIKLTEISSQLHDVRDCKLSINAVNELLFYCYVDFLDRLLITRQAQYNIIRFKYSQKTQDFQYKIIPVEILLGSRVVIEQIWPMMINQEVFQFIKYNYQNSPDQFELIVGKFKDNKLDDIKVLESSALNNNLIGYLAFDISLYNNNSTFLMLTLQYGILTINIYDQYMNLKNSSQVTYAKLNETVFRDQEYQNLISIQILKITNQRILALLGTENSFYEIEIQIGVNPIVFLYFKFNNYFQCKHTIGQYPQLLLNRNRNIEMLFSACTKDQNQKNFFFDNKFEYNQQNQLVYIQIFNKTGKLEGDPMRVLQFIEGTNRQNYKFLLYKSNLNESFHVLFENDTYFLADFKFQRSISFKVQRKQNTLDGQTINVSLVAFNEYMEQNINIFIRFINKPEIGINWTYLSILISLAVVIIIFIIIIIYRSQKKTQQERNIQSKSLEILYDAIREVVLNPKTAQKKDNQDDSESD